MACGESGDQTNPSGSGSGNGTTGSMGNGATSSAGGGSGTSTGVGASGQGGATTSGSPGGALVINEIMYDPFAVTDDAGEWVELYNPGTSPVDMTGYVLRDAFNNEHVMGSFTVQPGAYVVLGNAGSNNGGYGADYVYPNDQFLLANGGDTVILEDGSGNVIDEVVYGVASPWPVATSGRSIELINETDDNAVGANWTLAVQTFGDGDRGTPGKANGGAMGGFDIDGTVADWHNPSLETSIRFAPFDDLEAHVIEQLEAAQTSIHLAFFNVRLEAVRDLLIAKTNAGVDVKVILDGKQQALSYNTMGAELDAAGVDVTEITNDSATDATMHDKFIVIDGATVLTGSANLSYTALNVSDEDIVTLRNNDLAARYELEFQELLAGTEVDSAAYSGSPAIRAWMGPEDSLYQKVEASLTAAQTHALVAMFQLNATSIVDELIATHNRGVKVVVILDETQATQTDQTADETLAAAGIPVILADATGGNFAEMHSKFVVIDHETVLMGSYNWTNLGSFFNDENILIIDDATLATRVEGKFAQLIDAYSSSSASTLGLTTGNQNVTFDVPNVTLDPGYTLKIKSLNGGPFATAATLTSGSLTTAIAAGTAFQYRYEIHDGSGAVFSESATRTFTVPYAPGPFSVTDAMRP